MALRGNLEEATHDRIRGWAFDDEHPREAVVLQITADGAPIARVVANIHRGDLDSAGIGDGRHAFDLHGTAFKLPLAGCLVHAVNERTGDELPNSPARVEAPLDLNGASRHAIEALLASPGTDEALRERAAFVASQADQLLNRLSDRRSSRLARAAERARKWRWRPEDGPEPERLAPRALVLDSTAPTVGRDAGSNALVSHMQSLRRLGYDVMFAPADMQANAGVQALAALGFVTAVSPWCASVEELLRREGETFDLIYFHKLDAAARYVALARHYCPRARRIYCVADLHSLRLARQAKVEERPELVAHSNFVRVQEFGTAASCHSIVTHSAVEAAMLKSALPHAAIETIPWAVPLRPTPAPFEERAGIAFVGSFSHAPNLDGAIWLMDEIMPLVWQTDPAIECLIVGSDMPAAVSEPRDPRIHALGRVADMDEVLGRVRMTVASLAFGAGLKGKVAESLAAGVPCVCSPVAAEGFDLPEPCRALVAGDTAAIAAAIVRLHNSPAEFAACREAGMAYVGRAFSTGAVDSGMRRAAGLPAQTPVAAVAASAAG